MTLAEEFLELFKGSAVASYDYDPSRDGPKYLAVEHGLTPADIERHLEGRLPSVLSVPILPSGLCHFACGDCDRHDEADEAIDHVALAKQIQQYHLPLIITRSKSPKSCHIWLFFKDVDGFDAATARRLIQKYMSVLEISGDIEIFPKQEQLKIDPETGELKRGSGINLPYFGNSRIGFGRDGEELSLEEFLTLAHKCQSFGRKLAERDLDVGVSGPGAPSSDDQDHPMLAATAKRIHTENLKALKQSNKMGHWNDTINKTAFWAGRVFAAKVFDVTEAKLKDQIREAAAATPQDERQMESTLESGWSTGILKPLRIIEDLFPERTATLKEFNERFYVVENFGGKCRLCWEEIDESTGSLYLGNQDFADFNKAHMHEQILVGETATTTGRDKKKTQATQEEYMSKSEFWLKSPDRRQFRKVVYAPNEKLPPDVHNLWRGFRVEAQKGNIDLWKEHVLENVCRGDEARFNWLTRWMAWKVRNPGLMNGTCPVLIGPEGVGKNMAIDPFAFLWGPHAFAVTQREHILGHFNSHLRACSVLIGNEALYAGDRSGESVLKSLITDDSFVLESKGVDPVIARNRISLVIVSNEPWVIPASVSARRFTVLDVGDRRKEDIEFFRNMQLQLSGSSGKLSGYSALLHYLMFEVDLRDYVHNKIIVTEALAGQQAQSLRGVESLWHALLYRGQIPGGLKGGYLQSERLLTWARLQHNRKWEGITDRQLGQLLGENSVGDHKGMGFKHAQPRPVVDGAQVRAWVIPHLWEARAKWDQLRFVEQWPDVQPLQIRTDGKTQTQPGPDDWMIVPVGDETKVVINATIQAVTEAAAAAAASAATAVVTAARAEGKEPGDTEQEDKDIPF